MNPPPTRRDGRLVALSTEMEAIHRYNINRASQVVEEARIRTKRNFWKSHRGRSVVGLAILLTGCLIGVATSDTVIDAANRTRLSVIRSLGGSVDAPAAVANVPNQPEVQPVEVVAPSAVVKESETAQAPEIQPKPAEDRVLIPTPLSGSGAESLPRLPAFKLKADDAAANNGANAVSPEETGISLELAREVQSSRERLKKSTSNQRGGIASTRQTVPDTGVNVMLPKKRNAPAPETKASHASDGQQSSGPATGASFSVIRYLDGGLLIRSGSTVRQIRLGEKLPDGTLLTSVDSKQKDYKSSSGVAQ